MTKNIFYSGKTYSCEFVKDVQVTGEDIVDEKYRIFVDKTSRRAFLVNELIMAIVSEVLPKYAFDAILDKENKDHEKEVNILCNDFALRIHELWEDEVEIN